MFKELAEVKACLEEKSNKQRSEAEGSSYALELAQATLKERYTKMSKRLESNQKNLEQALCHIVSVLNCQAMCVCVHLCVLNGFSYKL